MDRHVGSANLPGNRLFEMIGEIVGGLDGEVFADGEVEIHELLRAGAAGAQVVDVDKFSVMGIDETDDFVADFIGEFGVEHVMQGMAGEAESLLEDVEGDEERHDRVEPGGIDKGEDHQSRQQRAVGVDIHGKVQGIGLQCRGIGRLADAAQIAADPQGGSHREGEDDNAVADLLHLDIAGVEATDRLEHDPPPRGGDDEGLDEGGQRFVLAVAEGMAFVRWLFGLANGEEVDPGHNDVEGGVDRRGDDCQRAGKEADNQLQNRQTQRRDDRITRRADL